MASRDQDEALAGLLRRSLSRPANAGDDCPGPDILAAYYERSLEKDEVTRYELHFSQCAHCREQLAAMVRSEEKPQPASKDAWAWDWRWLAATAAVLIIVSAWGLTWSARRSSKPVASNQSQPTPLLALSEPNQPPAPGPESPPAPSLDAPSPKVSPPPPQPEPKRAAPVLRDEPNQNLPAASKKQEIAPAREFSNRRDASLQELDKTSQVGSTAPRVGEPQALASAAAPAIAVTPRSAAAPPSPKANDANGVIVAEEKARSTTEAKSGDAPAPTSLNALKNRTQSAAVQATDQLSDQVLITTPDSKVLWRIAGAGFVERTTDGGATWQGQLPEPDAQLSAGSAPGAKVCWLVGRNGLILLTKDAANWKKIPPPIPADFTLVTAKNVSSATITAADGQKFVTTDGGKKWKPAP